MHEGFRAVHSEAAQRNKNQLGGFDTEKKAAVVDEDKRALAAHKSSRFYFKVQALSALVHTTVLSVIDGSVFFRPVIANMSQKQAPQATFQWRIMKWDQ